MLSQRNIKIKLKLNKKFFVDEVSAKFFGKSPAKKNTSLKLRRHFVDKLFAMCRWALKEVKSTFKKVHASIRQIGFMKGRRDFC